MDAVEPRKGKRAHKRTFQTILSGVKMQHLKKKDGEPLWRSDLQYDFLSYIFNNDAKVFANSYTNETGFTFADIYIDAMARSSKCSKILSEKLLGDRRAGLSIAMVCLLVNVGRMNTTLNFFPEMKAQLRTYHPIPSLQSNDTADYKQLQDAPRLKSILKGACEDRDEPNTMEQLFSSKKKPPTNPINLVFLMSTYSPKVEEVFFVAPTKFFDLIMDHTQSSASRGRAFLWLMWACLETNFSAEQLAKNPFGAGMTKIPPLVKLTEAEIEKENVNTPAEISFGNQMTLQRLTYLEKTGSGVPSPSLRKPRGLPPLATQHSTATPLKVPTAVTSKDKQTLHEFRGLLREKRARRRLRRLNAANPVKDTWDLIKDMDPVYNSDTEFVAFEQGEEAKELPPGMASAGLLDLIGDYGEYTSSMLKALKSGAQVLEAEPENSV